jgi:hypothetical protein
MSRTPSVNTIRLISSNYASMRNLQFSMIAVVPGWLQEVSEELIASAKNYASRFGSANRKFSYIQVGSPDAFASEISCTGQYVEQSAWDIQFSVPVGGFKFGDKDPITGENFPGGFRGNGSYITLIDKPEAEGEVEKRRARTYSDSKYSGKTITKLGFFSQALRKNFGEGILLSEIGKRNLNNLALGIGVQMAHAIGNQIKFDCARKGLSCTIIGPDIINVNSIS